MRDLEEITTLKTQLAGEGSSRHDTYDVLLEATHGNYYDSVVTETWKKWQGIIYEPGETRSSKRRKLHVVVNLLNPVIEGKRALYAIPPAIRCPYPDLSETAIARSDLLEKTLRYLWRVSRMDEQLAAAGWYGPLLGTSIWAVWPDFTAHMPKIICRSPYGFYGEPVGSSIDGIEWKSVMWVTPMLARRAVATWPELAGQIPEGATTVEAIEYWDADQKVTIVDPPGFPVTERIENKLGFVPVVAVPNIAQPDRWWGKSDVIDAIPLVNELNKRFNMENQAISDMAGAPWEAISPAVPPEDLALDPGAINPFEGGGGMRKSQTNSLPYQLFQSNNVLRNYVDEVSDFPAIMQGQVDSSIWTGKGVSNLRMPWMSKIELRQRTLYSRLQILNVMAMRMWKLYWGRRKHMIMGSQRGAPFAVEIDLADFGGVYDNEVYLDSASYFDQQSKAIVGLQMVQNNLLSAKTFIEKLNPFVDDTSAEQKQIQAEQVERIQMALAAQQLAQAPQNTFPNLGGPPTENKALSSGNAGIPEPMPAPPGVNPWQVEQMAGGEGTPPTMAGPNMQEGPNNVLYVLADLIRSVPNTKGQIFLTGSILEGPIDKDGIEIWFTDMTDWATVRQFVFKQLPDVKGMFHPYPGEPTVPYLEVTPGTSGYEITVPQGAPQGEEFDLDEEMGAMPAMGPGMMGGGPLG